jgi:hypothetical protein
VQNGRRHCQNTAAYPVRGTLPQHHARGDILSEGDSMGGLLRTAGAGYGAKKLGGGCISTVIIFIILFWLLGYIF